MEHGILQNIFGVQTLTLQYIGLALIVLWVGGACALFVVTLLRCLLPRNLAKYLILPGALALVSMYWLTPEWFLTALLYVSAAWFVIWLFQAGEARTAPSIADQWPVGLAVGAPRSPP